MTIPTRMLLLMISGLLSLPLVAQVDPTTPETADQGAAATSTAPEQQAEPSEQSDDDDRRRVRRIGDSIGDTGEAWTPNLNSSDVSRQVERKLGVAQQALINGNLTTPENQSALFYFQSVLELEPGNLVAEAGIDEIATRLADQALAAQAAGNRDQALALINQVRTLRPDFPGISNLVSEISRNEELEILEATAAQQLSDGDFLGENGTAAVATLRQILEIEADNTFAQEGLATIEAAILAEAAPLIQSRQYDQAEALLQRAESINGGSDGIAAARAAIVAEQLEEIEERYAAAQTAFGEGDLDQATALIAQLRQDGFDEAALLSMEQQIEEERILLDFQAGTVIQDTLAGAVPAPEMIVIARGQFEMGSANRERGRSDNEGPQRQIRIARPFAISKTEITVAQFRAFITDSGYQTDAERNGESTIYNVLAGNLKKRESITWQNDFSGQSANDDDPVVHVSWNDAVAYANWLSQQTGERYRLPSEAEFEYALRGGTTTPYWWGRNAPRDTVENLTGDGDKMADRWEWPDPFERYEDGHWGPSPVAEFEPNPSGLYDMGGNVMEWTADCYVANLESVPEDGSAAPGNNCTVHVIRGGSWAGAPDSVRSASRTSAGATATSCLLGFRVARSL